MDTVHECDRRTDRITTTKTVQRRASHGKNVVSLSQWSSCSLLLTVCDVTFRHSVHAVAVALTPTEAGVFVFSALLNEAMGI